MANADSTRPAHHFADEKPGDTIEAHYASLERLEERLRHELMPDEDRQELRDRVLRLRRDPDSRPGRGSQGLRPLIASVVGRGLERGPGLLLP